MAKIYKKDVYDTHPAKARVFGRVLRSLHLLGIISKEYKLTAYDADMFLKKVERMNAEHTESDSTISIREHSSWG